MVSSRKILFCLCTFLTSLFSTVQADTIYCVHNNEQGDSQFCYVSTLSGPSDIKILQLGTLKRKCDIESLDIYHELDTIYAASGSNTSRQGHLYRVDKSNGNIFDLGNINAEGVDFKEVDTISFHPNTKNLWGWARHNPDISQEGGLFIISSADLLQRSGMQIKELCETFPEVDDISAKRIIRPTARMEIGVITWNWNGTKLYGVENCREGCDIKLWVGQTQTQKNDDLDVNSWKQVCQIPSLTETIHEKLVELYPSEKLPIVEIEALESLPLEMDGNNTFSDEDLLLLGFRGVFHLLYALVTVPPSPQLPCKIMWIENIDSGLLSNIKSFTYSSNPRPKTVNESLFVNKSNKFVGTGGEILINLVLSEDDPTTPEFDPDGILADPDLDGPIPEHVIQRIDVGDRLVGIGASHTLECLDCSSEQEETIYRLGSKTNNLKLAVRAFEVVDKVACDNGFNFTFGPLSPEEYSTTIEIASKGAVKIPVTSIPKGTMILSFDDSTPNFILQDIPGSPDRNWVEATNGDRHWNVGIAKSTDFWMSNFVSDDIGLLPFLPDTVATGTIRFGLSFLSGDVGPVCLKPVPCGKPANCDGSINPITNNNFCLVGNVVGTSGINTPFPVGLQTEITLNPVSKQECVNLAIIDLDFDE